MSEGLRCGLGCGDDAPSTLYLRLVAGSALRRVASFIRSPSIWRSRCAFFSCRRRIWCLTSSCFWENSRSSAAIRSFMFRLISSCMALSRTEPSSPAAAGAASGCGSSCGDGSSSSGSASGPLARWGEAAAMIDFRCSCCWRSSSTSLRTSSSFRRSSSSFCRSSSHWRSSSSCRPLSRSSFSACRRASSRCRSSSRNRCCSSSCWRSSSRRRRSSWI
mmetsp:Transcript_94184/g.266541  ORF Transcript_94184/g.266541 Transcript_94184/m.266541 type:complete len:218 (+) Transcript_94184:1078-1731(+)